MNQNNDNDIFEGEDFQDEEENYVAEYDITVSPNDFNINTIFDFIDSGVVNIPGFQRNYVWDIKRASKLIESLLIGLPIPQIFLYEEKKNKFLVIDGQQRLMTIYYFKKRRFPKAEKRVELRKIFDEQGGIPDSIINNNDYFIDFNLKLPKIKQGQDNQFNNKNFSTLDEDNKISFGYKTIRNIVIKQNAPEDGGSAIFEIFNRLNSGGVNLTSQEIRTSLYHSKFYEMLYDINLNDDWRYFLPSNVPNLYMKDIEILLRGFSMLIYNREYKPSMTMFLNESSRKAKSFNEDKISTLKNIFIQFIQNMRSLGEANIFRTEAGRFNISMFEAIFCAMCEEAYTRLNASLVKQTSLENINSLKADQEFKDASLQSTASTKNVGDRIRIAKEKL
ncbi:GmrSD restriction endonuclease domain-containing protein [Campylobacter showae]|jgi:hypothetical protein|uniref:GmrSD restriction endonuclease domain-containing protein n=1 Tax=Campylobacter showae TaxID=204 RepID=UPI000F07D683|nr:DUF262 domain-containing protein [Campylobacter showae]